MGVIVLLMATVVGWEHFHFPNENPAANAGVGAERAPVLNDTAPPGERSDASLGTAGTNKSKPPRHVWVPTEVVLACHIAMGLGTLFGGWRIVKTMGQRIIRLRPVDGFCAEIGAAATLVMTIFGGIPVSTTHTITGSIVGVGAMKRLSAVRWGVAGRVVWAWILTIPGAALVAALTWWLAEGAGIFRV